MRRASTSICAGIFLAASASGALALGFGSVSNSTVLGQPLAFTVPLRMDADEFVSVECVFAEVHAGDVRIPPSQVRVSLDPSRESGERMLRITTTAPIDEPVVSVDVGLGCPVRLSRKFVAFVDPPVIGLAQAPAEQPAPQPPPAATSSAPPTSAAIIAPPRDATRPQVAATPKAPPRKAARPVARPEVIAAPSTAPTQRARADEPRAKVAPAAPAVASGARLKLETAEAPSRSAAAKAAAASAPATGSTAATVGAIEASAALAAAAAASAAEAQQAQERERLRTLEESVARLRSDTDATRSSMATLQARLREAEASRYNNPLVYALIAIIALLLLAMALLVRWVRARDKQRADWWAANAEEAAAPRPPKHAAAAVEAPRSQAPSAPDSVVTSGIVESFPASGVPLTWKPTLAIPELDRNEVPKRAVTAEELIDLEQQAEFFITLGQDDSAIDLLVGHLNSSGGISPLPYLKLMEIHRRRGDLAAYERIREHFNQRFNAYAPAGDARSVPARSLDQHPDVMAQLQEAWPAPARAMGLLESLLFKSGGRDAAFDLAAYREVLFLHEVARDIYEHDASPTTVDVLLPLDMPGPDSAGTPLMTAMPASPQAAAVSVDLDIGQPRDEEAEAAAARAERRKERYGDDDFLFGSHTGGDWAEDSARKPGPLGRKGSK